MVDYKNIIYNVAVIYIAEILSKFFLFAFIVFAARFLGVNNFGELSYAMTMYALMLVLSDCGLNISLTKDIAQRPEKGDVIFFAALWIRMILTVGLLALSVIYLDVTDNQANIKLFIIISGASLIPAAYSLNLSFGLRGRNLVKHDGMLRIFGSLASTVLCLIALKFYTDIIAIAIALAAGNLILFGLGIWFNRKLSAFRLPHEKIGFNEYKRIVHNSWPFFSVLIMVSIFTRVDTMILQQLGGSTEVGLYHSSTRIMDAMLLLQTAFGLALFPVLSVHMASNDSSAIDKITHLGIKYMALSGIFLAVICYYSADRIINLLYFSSEFTKAIGGLQLLSVCIFILYLATPIGYLLCASRVAHVVVFIQAAMVIVSLTLNIKLIPIMGHVGAITTRIVVEGLGLSLSVIVLHSTVLKIHIIRELWRPVVAGLTLAAIMHFTSSLLLLPLYASIYLGLIYLLGGFNQGEISLFTNILQSKFREK